MAQSHELKDLKFEEALKRLEKLVAELDRSELDLELRLKKFEEGTKLARVLVKKLEHAKKRVDVLVKAGATEADVVPFTDDSDADDSARASETA